MLQRNKGHQVHHLPSQTRRFHVCHGKQFTKLYVVTVVEQKQNSNTKETVKDCVRATSTYKVLIYLKFQFTPLALVYLEIIYFFIKISHVII